ncbi:class I SAM-dependent methyltransferase [Nocardia jejuensis]|uniref:class I SAM-dependent methyltransferase n=1 Tax=Nocardia jejuensis TaxID=328049 RepID=UPI00082A727B|nr:class I SAM-dependent methyltransferase [Nocardia jejuensis]
MEFGRPSRTALATAHARAYHQVAIEPQIFADPLALRILGVQPGELSDRDTATLGSPGRDRSGHRNRRMFLAARARYAEEVVADAVARGTRQVVILGAGLDTFAYRSPHPALRVFEVDHPDTQAWKRRLLSEADIPIPGTLSFAPIDFETHTLAQGLAETNFDREEPAVFVWLGVVMYLTRDTIVETLRYIAGQGRPSQVVFDYLRPPVNAADRERLRYRSNRVAAVGEPFLSFFTPAEIGEILRSLGLPEIRDNSAPSLIARYIGAALSDSPAPNTPPHVVHAARRA